MTSNSRTVYERQIFMFCKQAALICNTKEFKQLHKEVSKLYRKKGIQNFKTAAFQDSLYSMYMEQYDGERSSQTLSY